MTPERHEQIKRLFLAACELEGAARADYLARECSEDDELRTEIESLLKHHLEKTILENEQLNTGPADVLMQADIPTKISPVQGPQVWTAGTIVAGRYRIINILGQGGMGQVYRAEDLTLHRNVALKFITPHKAGDRVWLAHFYNEARLSLTITHPNVCRVYDIGDAEGRAFLSMEYIDGENLASLLKQVGRFTPDKVIQIARQMCSGLAAAHAHGVLHRDLKLANIMLDGSGRVRITDFGIAVLQTDEDSTKGVVGTLPYIAPEIREGKPATIQSEIYSLGLVLYELFAGRILTEKEIGHVADLPAWLEFPDTIDPALRGLLSKCLERNPDQRPSSMYEVLAMLPGEDPLAAMMAEGETPPPEMIAAIRSQAVVHPKIYIGLFVAALAAISLVAILADQTFFLIRAGLDKSPDVLEEKALQIIHAVTGSTSSYGDAQGFTIDPASVEYIRKSLPNSKEAIPLAENVIPSLYYEYRQGFSSQYFEASQDDEIVVRLDTEGFLLQYLSPANMMVTPQSVTGPETDWKSVFVWAGLNLANFRAVEPLRYPPTYADRRWAWEGSRPDWPDKPLRVEAASLLGRMVYFEVIWPWENAPISGRSSSNLPILPLDSNRLLTVLFIITFVFSLPLAWRHLRTGRGDRRGAGRLASFVFIVQLVLWLVQPHLMNDREGEALEIVAALRRAIFAAIAFWIYYQALEPYVRRFWPHALISWSRVLTGRCYDSLIGRDLLVGTLFGATAILVMQLNSLLCGSSPRAWLLFTTGGEIGSCNGFLYVLGTLAYAMLRAAAQGMILAMIMLLLRLVIRIPWVANVLLVIIAFMIYAINVTPYGYFAWVAVLLSSAACVLILVRAGLFCVVFSFFVAQMLARSPVTLNVKAWYAGTGGFAVTVVLALLILGLVTTIRRNPYITAQSSVS